MAGYGKKKMKKALGKKYKKNTNAMKKNKSNKKY